MAEAKKSQLHMTKEEKKQQRAERKRIRRSAWVDEDLREIEICKGVTIDRGVYEIRENRYLTLIIKGLIVYLITAGGIGCYLSAFEIEYSGWLFHLVILSTAILCATLYHSWRSENLGYLVFFSVYAALLILFRDYINSGFYAILNDTNDYASIYFNTDKLVHYNERIANRYMAITIAVTLIGIALNILLNNYILRRARYMIAAFLGITINLIPLYMEKEPHLIYSLMVIAGVCMTYILKCGRHFTLSRNDHIFKRRKWGLSYGLGWKSLLQGMLLTLLLVLIMANVVNLVRPRNEYAAYRPRNPYKEATREQMQNLITLGLAGLWNWYPNNGGLSTGALGGVSSIRLDYQTDINVIYTPYSMDTLYIKNLIGCDYLPYVNRWRQPEEYLTAEEQNLYEAEALKKAYEDGADKAARGLMRIQNVEAEELTYHPYYTSDEPGVLSFHKENEYVYYPMLDEELLTAEPHQLNPGYLTVPEGSAEAVQKLVEDAGLSMWEDPEVSVARLANYYEENIPYTIRPGSTPRDEDFVSYFLTENRKGYCAHFASAATLAFRAIGIPARYCEGYAISYREVTGRGEIIENGEALYDEFYDGYNALGKTAVISVNATDADAHAWVEIYVTGKGWIPVEVTPSTTIDEDDGISSFWDAFNNIFGDGDVDNAQGGGGGGGFNVTIGEGTLRVALFILLGLMAAAGLFFLGKHFAPEIRYHIGFRRGDASEKLVLYFGHCLWKRRRDKELAGRMNYREQTECLYDRRLAAGVPDTDRMTYRPPEKKDGRRVNTVTLEELIATLERAGFARETISDEEYRIAKDRVDELFLKP